VCCVTSGRTELSYVEIQFDEWIFVQNLRVESGVLYWKERENLRTVHIN
jgi:hypothetical protein